MNYVHQYHVYNEYMSFIVSVPIETHEYAENFAKRVALDYYDYTEDQFKDMKCEFIVKFWMESAINLNELNKPIQ